MHEQTSKDHQQIPEFHQHREVPHMVPLDSVVHVEGISDEAPANWSDAPLETENWAASPEPQLGEWAKQPLEEPDPWADPDPARPIAPGGKPEAGGYKVPRGML